MANYAPIPVKTQLEGLRAQIADAKKKNVYAGQEAQWDKKVLLVLDHHCNRAEDYRTLHGKFAVQKRNECKKVIDDMEGQLKKKHLIEGEYGWLAQQPATIAAIAKESADDSSDMMEALKEYRENWSMVAKECLHDPSIVQPYQDARQRGINTQDPIAIALRKRCAEYVVRAGELVKIAQQRRNAGKVDIAAFSKELTEIEGKMAAGKTEIDDLVQKRSAQVRWYGDMAKKKAWTPDELKLADGQATMIATSAKAARGLLKTLRAQLDGLEKRGKEAGPGWQEDAQKAVKNAKATYTQATAASTTLDQHEKKCDEVVKKMKK